MNLTVPNNPRSAPPHGTPPATSHCAATITASGTRHLTTLTARSEHPGDEAWDLSEGERGVIEAVIGQHEGPDAERVWPLELQFIARELSIGTK